MISQKLKHIHNNIFRVKSHKQKEKPQHTGEFIYFDINFKAISVDMFFEKPSAGL